MADISKINAVALANIAKLDAVLAANLAKVNGLVFSTAPGFVGLLDTYTGAAAAYSTRRLASATTVLIRVRRDTGGATGDDDEADVAYDSNDELSLDSAISNASAGVTATTLGQFINVGTVGGTTYTNPDSLTVTASCFVDTWYDQAGSNDASQATYGSQPQIHSGTVNTDLITENGKPTIYQDGTQYFDSTTLSSSVNQNDMGLFAVGRWAASSPAFPGIASLFTPVEDEGMSLAYRSYIFLYNDGPVNSAGAFDFTQKLWSGYADNASSDVKGYIDGVQIASTTPSSEEHTKFVVGNLGHTISATKWNGYLQEAILFGNSTKADHSNIEGNQNAHYQIGNFGTPTSGLLATYTGAAAAYSVRQLANTAALSMRVRRDTAGGTGDDDEADVLFDFTLTNPTISLDSRINNASTGVASTTLGEFLNVGTVNGTTYTNPDSLTVTASCFVDEWKDQSGNSNHASQATHGSQPQIHSGTVNTDLITENGKPAIDFDGSNDYMVSVNAYSTGTNESHFMTRSAQAIDRRILCTRGIGAAGTVQGWHHKGWAGDLCLVDDGTGNSMIVSNTTPASGQRLRSAFLSQSSIDLYNNGSSFASATGSTGSFNSGNNLHIGTNSNGASTQFFSGNMQEMVLYNSDQSTNRTGIETDINTYFSIY